MSSLGDKFRELDKPVLIKPVQKIPKIKKLVVPNHIKTLFNDLDISINSIWGVQSNNKVKWKAKFKLWLIFKEWFEEAGE